MLELPALDSSATLGTEAPILTLASEPALGTVCVVGLGYVGLPVAVEFGKVRPTVGYDLSSKRVHTLRQFNDPTGEVSSDELQKASKLACTDDAQKIREADFIIVAVPTPVNEARQP